MERATDMALTLFSYHNMPNVSQAYLHTFNHMKEFLKTCILLIGMAIFLPLTGSSKDVQVLLYDVETTDEFHNGLATFRKDRLYGYINTSGETAITPKFALADRFYDGYAYVKTTEGSQGIIDTNGNFVVEPQSYYEITVKPDYSNKSDAVIFEIKNTDNGLKAAFYNGQFLTDFEVDGFIMLSWPFADIDTSSGKVAVNLATSDIFRNAHSFDYGKFVCVFSEENDKEVMTFFDSEMGDRIPMSMMTKSKDGVVITEIPESKSLYRLIDEKTGRIINDSIFAVRPYWVNNIFASGSKVFNSKGHVIYSIPGSIGIDAEPYGFSVQNGNNHYTFYDTKGNIIEENNDLLYRIYGPWYRYEKNGEHKIINIETHRILDYKERFCFPREDVMTMEKNSKYYFMNMSTGKIYGPFNYCKTFTEGYCIVKDDSNGYFLIDKNGKKYNFPVKVHYIGDISEGSIGARWYDKLEHICDGYLSLPDGLKSHLYNQTNFSDNYYASLQREANDEFEKKHYAKAKDMFYRIHLHNPTETYALSQYGACLFNMGYYAEAETVFEMCLDLDPDSSYCQDGLKRSRNALSDSQEQESAGRNRASIWNALSNLANAFAQSASALSGNSYVTPTYSVSTALGETNYDGSSSASFSVDSGNYQNQYDNWERIARQHYNSLTNLGSSRREDGKRIGTSGQGASSSKYVRMKRSLREAQREMRSIRQKASKAGVTIQQSEWENATVSY